jgi:flagellin
MQQRLWKEAAMRIDVNVLRAVNNYNSAVRSIGQSIEQLSSGSRLTRAATDSSSLVVNAKLRSQLSGLQQAVRNAQEGFSVLSVADGALGDIFAGVMRARELAVAAGSTGIADSAARSAYDSEAQDAIQNADMIAVRTMYATKTLLDGSYNAQEFMVDDEAANVVSVTIADSRAAALGIAGLDLVSAPEAAISALAAALDTITTRRSQLGAMSNRFSATMQVLQSTVESLIMATSRMSDTDMAQTAGQYQRDRAMVVQGARALDQAMAASVRSLRVLR